MPDGLVIAEVVLACIILAVLVPVVLLVVRRRWLSQQGWVFDCSLRRLETTPSSNWMLGVARLNGDTVEWYRVFSWSLKPLLSLRRGETQIVTTRDATEAERTLLADQRRVAELRNAAGTVEVAMAPPSMTALLSWLEAAPPGHGYRRL